ncbi:MAG: D-alanyl-D-alanine carboxypeptidase family protein, partial [Oscillospiraceae bacterium]|nr:D-alanyl-D-alanine carboxypeptidase family protein [Oscillospiraceae bacterium]
MNTISAKRKVISCAMLAVILLTACGCAQAQDRSPIVSDTLQPSDTPRATVGGVPLISASNPLPDGFAVGALVNLYGEKRSFALASVGICLTRETFEAANQMFAQAKRDGVSGFILTSGYRTEDEQRALYEAATDRTAAPPGA